MEIEFDVMWHTDQTNELAKLDIAVSFADYITKKMTFYSIDCIAPWEKEGFNYCYIMSGGDEYIATRPYDEVKQIIRAVKNIKEPLK